MSLTSIIHSPYSAENANGKLAFLNVNSNVAQPNLRLVTHSGRIIELKRPPSYDQLTMEKVKQCILENLSNPDYKITDLARDTAYSQRQLTRIVKKMTGMSPVQYFLELRLQTAYELLQHRTFVTIAQVRDEVGIIHPSYFNRKFKDRFGIRPSDLLEN